jgi:hypothetical protein
LRIVKIADPHQPRFAQRLRTAIGKELGKTQNSGQDVDEAMAGFDKVEDLLAKCVEIAVQKLLRR